jgi:hypothetical protein
MGERALRGGKAAREWLRTKANSIEGGTSEIQLGIVAKHMPCSCRGPDAALLRSPKTRPGMLRDTRASSWPPKARSRSSCANIAT